MKNLLLTYLLAFLLAACSPAPPADREVTGTGLVLSGRIESFLVPLQESKADDAASASPGASRQAQALMTDIANGATVAFIDMATGKTMATAVSSTDGMFDIALPDNFTFPNSQPFALEAVKGLGVGLKFNRAGASVARVRTIVAWDFGWRSLTSGGLTMNRATTALAIVAAHKNLATSDLLGLLGQVQGSAFGGNTTVTAGDFDRVFSLVTDALAEDQDPVEAVTFWAAGGTPDLRFNRKRGNVEIDDTATPATVAVGGTVTVTGQNLPTTGPDTPTLALGTVPVATWSVNAARNQATFSVPAGAYASYLEIRQGPHSWLGPFIRVRGTVGTLAGADDPRFRDGPGPWARFNMPHDVAADAAGNIFVSDFANHRVRKISPGGTSVTTVAGSGTPGTADGLGTAAQFNGPGILVEPGGAFYIVKNYGDSRFCKVSPGGAVTTLFGPNPNFSLPHQVAIDTAGVMYVADYGSHTIKKVTQAGAMTVLAGLAGSPGTSDGAPTATLFNNPTGVNVDPAGKVFIIADRSNGRLRKMDLDLNATYTLTSGSGWVQNPSSGVEGFSCPQSVAMGPDGSSYVAEFCSDRVRKISPTGAISLVAGTVRGFKDGPIASAQLILPHGIAVDAQGTVYVSEFYQHRIRAIVP